MGVFEVCMLVRGDREQSVCMIWLSHGSLAVLNTAIRNVNALKGLTERLITFPHSVLVPSSPIITTERLSTAWGSTGTEWKETTAKDTSRVAAAAATMNPYYTHEIVLEMYFC